MGAQGRPRHSDLPRHPRATCATRRRIALPPPCCVSVWCNVRLRGEVWYAQCRSWQRIAFHAVNVLRGNSVKLPVLWCAAQRSIWFPHRQTAPPCGSLAQLPRDVPIARNFDATSGMGVLVLRRIAGFRGSEAGSRQWRHLLLRIDLLRHGALCLDAFYSSVCCVLTCTHQPL